MMMLAFHNDPKIKEKYLSRVKAHYAADEIVQGKYWENGKGCAVGCTIQNDDILSSYGGWHQRYEEALGIPRMIARLEDRIFEGLNNAEAKEFPVNFLESIKVGADLSLVVPQFFVWLLIDKKDGVICFAQTQEQKKSIRRVANLYRKKIKGDVVTEKQWRAAYVAAADAAAYVAAYAAAAYVAAYAAAAAYVAAYAAADAADAAAYVAAYVAAAARREHFSKMANKLLELLTTAPVPHD